MADASRSMWWQAARDGQSWSAVRKISEDEAPIEIDASMHADAVEAGTRVLHRAIHGIRGAREEMIQLHYSEVPSAENYFVVHIELHEGLAKLKFRELQSLGSPLVSCEVPLTPHSDSAHSTIPITPVCEPIVYFRRHIICVLKRRLRLMVMTIKIMYICVDAAGDDGALRVNLAQSWQCVCVRTPRATCSTTRRLRPMSWQASTPSS